MIAIPRYAHSASRGKNDTWGLLSYIQYTVMIMQLLMFLMQDSSQPLMTVDQITRHLEELDTALRVVESEGRDLEEKIRKGSIDVAVISSGGSRVPELEPRGQ